MKYIELDKEEKQILDDIANDNFKQVDNFLEMKKELQSIAKETLSKTKSISIRISEIDLYKIRSKAIELGMPYQTLIGSVLHRFSKTKTT